MSKSIGHIRAGLILTCIINDSIDGLDVLYSIIKRSPKGYNFLELRPKDKSISLIISDFDIESVKQFQVLIVEPLRLKSKFCAFAHKGLYVPVLKIYKSKKYDN